MKKKTIHAPAFTDPNEIVLHLVGLKDVRVLSYCRRGNTGEITIEQSVRTFECPRCRRRARVKDRPIVRYVDLPFGGVPVSIFWKKHRLTCINDECGMQSFTLKDHRIAAHGCRLTTRAAKWVVAQMGTGRAISHVARELGCSWDVVNTATVIYGEALMSADIKRLKETTWLDAQPHHVKDTLLYGCLDMSAAYNAVFKVVTPKAIRVIDRFHVMRHATLALDQVRRRVQQQRLGHRGRRDDPLYKSRKLLVMGATRDDADLQQRLRDLLALGDDNGEVAFAYAVKEAVHDFYARTTEQDAEAFLLQIIERAGARSAPYEVRRFARTLKNWFDPILAWHQARVSNGPTEGMNNLIKRVKRVAFGFTNFRNFRIRALLYVGKPNFRLLASIVVK